MTSKQKGQCAIDKMLKVIIVQICVEILGILISIQ